MSYFYTTNIDFHIYSIIIPFVLSQLTHVDICMFANANDSGFYWFVFVVTFSAVFLYAAVFYLLFIIIIYLVFYFIIVFANLLEKANLITCSAPTIKAVAV